MKGVENTKARDLQKPFPGCMGRMINMFDLSSSMAGTKLLTEKAHRDGSPVLKAMDSVRARIEDKPMACGMWSSSRKSVGTPMKMLIAKEMSKDAGCMQMPPNVVAKLMGLDAAKMQKSTLDPKDSEQEGYPSQQEEWCYDDQMLEEIQSSGRDEDSKDVYDDWHKPSKTSRDEDQSLQKENCNESLTEKRMALVRRKFIEAKNLATDEKLIRSKEFQGALEILSSNRDLFLKFLDENSLSSKNVDELQTVTPLSRPRRITLLKPARKVDFENDKHFKNQQYSSSGDGRREMGEECRSSSLTSHTAESISQATRIVVLKPSLGQSDQTMNMAKCPFPSPGLLDRSDHFGSMKTYEDEESREIVKGITHTLRESLVNNDGDESLMSSVISSRYVGDDSSFNIVEHDYKEDCNLSDLEIATAMPRRSWDCTNRFDSPHSVSSFSRASYSPESSVIREAKKRLSERWALVATNWKNQEQRQERRSSSTLGEMLSIPHITEVEDSDRPTASSSRSCGGEESSLSAGGAKDGCSEEKSPRNLSRSISVPGAIFCENTGLDKEFSNSQHNVPKESAKLKSGKSTFKEIVSSLLFSKIKKSGGQKSGPSLMVQSAVQSDKMEATDKIKDDILVSIHDNHPEESTKVYCQGRSGWASTSTNNGPKQSISYEKATLSLNRARASQNYKVNQDHSSANLVLEAPFKEDVNNILRSCGSSLVGHPQALSRSPQIESLARSISWDLTCSQTVSPATLKHSTFMSKEDEEQEGLLFVQKLLSSGGFANKKCNKILAQWHSLDSPLDPLLLDELLAGKEEEAKCSVLRSNQKLLCGCVNATLLDIGHNILIGACPWSRAYIGALKSSLAGATVTEVVSGLARDWYSCDGERNWDEATNNSLLVDRMVKNEITGNGWAESMWSEIDEFANEIGGKVLGELVEDALTDMTSVSW